MSENELMTNERAALEMARRAAELRRQQRDNEEILALLTRAEGKGASK